MAQFTTSDGLNLHYEDEGDGQPVLCLAGLTRNSMDFKFLMPFLSRKRVIRLDYRGRGNSDYDPEFMNYSIPREALDAVELLDHLDIESANLIGTSRGGLIAMVLACSNPDRLRGVVLNDIGPDIAAVGLERIIEYVGKVPDFNDFDEAAERLHTVYMKDFPDVPQSRWRLQAEMMWTQEEGGGLGLRYDAKLRDAMIAQAAAAPSPDLWPLFDELAKFPLAVIRGENSDLLSAETFVEMQKRAPKMFAATVPNRGHVPFLDEAEALTAIKWLLEETE